MSDTKHTWKDLIMERFYEEEVQSKIREIEQILFGDDEPKIDQIVFASSENSYEKFILRAREEPGMLPRELYEQILGDLFSMQAEINKEIPTAINDLVAVSKHDYYE